MNFPLEERLSNALNKLAKWRQVFAGWQLGTRSLQDPECQAVRDHRELSLLMRAELNAVVAVLCKKGVCTQEEWCEALLKEARDLDKDMEARFPGFKTTNEGVEMDVSLARKTTAHWKP